MNKLFVFDLDDTLIDNVHDYSQPILDATMHIIKTLGNLAPPVSKIVEMIVSIDSAMVQHVNPNTDRPYFYSMERFPTSLKMTYKSICRQAKVTPNPNVEQEMYDIGMTAFDSRNYLKKVKPYAVDIIQFLKQQGDIVVLYTKGDERVQSKKIIALVHAGLRSFDEFNQIHIVNDKTSRDFRKIREFYRQVAPYDAYAVGNSFESDIEPALKEDYKGILIPVQIWNSVQTIDEELSLARISGTHIFKSLRDIEYLYNEL